MKLTTDDRKALQGAIRVLVEILQQASPEVPERVEEWPEDDTHLRGEFWKDRQGDVITYTGVTYTGDGWMFWLKRMGQWAPLPMKPDYYLPFTRTTDPSIPRTWDTLDDVPEGVERVTGDYAGTRREFARSPLSESGWFLRLKDGPYGHGWVELLVDRTKHVKNIKETS